jgi:hypothetical protein
MTTPILSRIVCFSRCFAFDAGAPCVRTTQAVLFYFVYAWESSNQFAASQAERDTRGQYVAPATAFVPLPVPEGSQNF